MSFTYDKVVRMAYPFQKGPNHGITQTPQPQRSSGEDPGAVVNDLCLKIIADAAPGDEIGYEDAMRICSQRYPREWRAYCES